MPGVAAKLRAMCTSGFTFPLFGFFVGGWLYFENFRGQELRRLANRLYFKCKRFLCYASQYLTYDMLCPQSHLFMSELTMSAC